jgi:hypothetical protein
MSGGIQTKIFWPQRGQWSVDIQRGASGVFLNESSPTGGGAGGVSRNYSLPGVNDQRFVTLFDICDWREMPESMTVLTATMWIMVQGASWTRRETGRPAPTWGAGIHDVDQDVPPFTVDTPALDFTPGFPETVQSTIYTLQDVEDATENGFFDAMFPIALDISQLEARRGLPQVAYRLGIIDDFNVTFDSASFGSYGFGEDVPERGPYIEITYTTDDDGEEPGGGGGGDGGGGGAGENPDGTDGEENQEGPTHTSSKLNRETALRAGALESVRLRPEFVYETRLRSEGSRRVDQ